MYITLTTSIKCAFFSQMHEPENMFMYEQPFQGNGFYPVTPKEGLHPLEAGSDCNEEQPSEGSPHGLRSVS